jgi:hypothetical protein
MIPPLKNNFRGMPGERIPHQWLNTIANFWNQLTVDGGGLSRCSDGRYTTITCGNGPSFLSSFSIPKTDGTVCTMEPGTFYREGTAVSIIGLPGTIQCGANRCTWLEENTVSGTVSWREGASMATSAGTLAIYPVHTIASKGTVIGTIHHEHPANVHTCIPFGVVAGDVIHFSGTSWARSAVGTPASGDMLKWDGSKYVKITPTQITVVTAVQHDESSHHLQYKSRTGYVLNPGTESGWTNFADETDHATL